MYEPLNPVALSFGFLHVTWYGIILGTATLAGLLFAIREGKRYHIAPEFFMDFMLIVIPSALIGARAYYVIFKWDEYRNNLAEIIMLWHGGIAIYGALIGGTIAAVVYVRKKGYNFWRIADICAPSLLIGQTIGRWGNFVNQEAYGGSVEESFLRGTLHLPDFIVNQMNVGGYFYHPAFLYESLWNLLGLALLLILRRQTQLRIGELFLSYFIWYSMGRFFIEGLRTDSLAIDGPFWLEKIMNTLWTPMTFVFESGNMAYGNIRISQLLSVAIIIIAVTLIYYRRKSPQSITQM